MEAFDYRSSGKLRTVLLVLLTVALTWVAPAGADAATKRRPLVFGIYPGGAAGTVGPGGQTRPEDPALRRRAPLNLRPRGRRLVLRLYGRRERY